VEPFPITFLKAETYEGQLDFKYEIAGKGKNFGLKVDKEDPPITNTMYLVGDKYYNINGFGNFIWGYFGKRLGIWPSQVLTLGADIVVKTNFFKNPFGIFYNEGDPDHEQQNIEDGYHYDPSN
jgi:hypothetical protein